MFAQIKKKLWRTRAFKRHATKHAQQLQPNFNMKAPRYFPAGDFLAQVGKNGTCVCLTLPAELAVDIGSVQVVLRYPPDLIFPFKNCNGPFLFAFGDAVEDMPSPHPIQNWVCILARIACPYCQHASAHSELHHHGFEYALLALWVRLAGKRAIVPKHAL